MSADVVCDEYFSAQVLYIDKYTFAHTRETCKIPDARSGLAKTSAESFCRPGLARKTRLSILLKLARPG